MAVLASPLSTSLLLLLLSLLRRREPLAACFAAMDFALARSELFTPCSSNDDDDDDEDKSNQSLQ